MAISDAASTLASPAGASSPQWSEAYGHRMSSAIMLLDSMFPTVPDDPLRPGRPMYPPTAAEMADFVSAVEVMDNPWSIVDRLSDGTLTATHRDIVQRVYPETYSIIFEKVSNELINWMEERREHKRTVAPHIRRGMTTLTNGRYDAAMDPGTLRILQKTYAQTEQQAQTIGRSTNLSAFSENTQTTLQASQRR